MRERERGGVRGGGKGGGHIIRMEQYGNDGRRLQCQVEDGSFVWQQQCTHVRVWRVVSWWLFMAAAVVAWCASGTVPRCQRES